MISECIFFIDGLIDEIDEIDDIDEIDEIEIDNSWHDEAMDWLID